jgi:ElaB/YqjD/DUF883 family membrane-anchored ribosome-binding protein
MAADSILSRELESLRDELAQTQQVRRASGPAPEPTVHARAPEPIQESPHLQELHDQLRDLANEVAEFFDEAEKNIAAHPAQSVIGALLVGILIGRLLASR